MIHKISDKQDSPDKTMNKTYGSQDYNQTIINEISQLQLEASMQNPDLRKKLRVDRIRKMTLASSKQPYSDSLVEDPKIPEWKKFKTL